MKLFKSIVLPLAALLFMFSSCNRDNDIDIITEENTEVGEIENNPLVNRSQGGSEEGLEFDCFVINYTFSFVDQEGTIYPITSEEDLTDLFENETFEVIDFVYPFTATTDEGEVTVNDQDEMAGLFASCTPTGGWEEGDFPAFSVNYDNSCYELVFPVSVKNEAGDITVTTNEEEFNEAIAAELVYFVFPLDLQLADGSTTTIDDIDMLFDALIGCNGFGPSDSLIGVDWDWEGGFESLGCYSLQFPFDVTLQDGSVITVNDHEELCELMLTGELVNYAFPLTLIDADGEEHIANNEEELEALLIACEDVWVVEFDEDLFFLFAGAQSGFGSESCYDINFPIDITFDNETVTVDDLIQLEQLIFGAPYSIVYPVDVTLTSDGSTVTLENSDDLVVLLTTCG